MDISRVVTFLLLFVCTCCANGSFKDVPEAREENYDVDLAPSRHQAAVESVIGESPSELRDDSENDDKAAPAKSDANSKASVAVKTNLDEVQSADEKRVEVKVATASSDSDAQSDYSDPAEVKNRVGDDGADVDDKENVESRQGLQQSIGSAGGSCPPSVVCKPGESCIMYLGFPNCFVPFTECKYMPCLNGGTCVNHRCVCLPGFTGILCGQQLPPRPTRIPAICPQRYCNGRGRCYVVRPQRFRCRCFPNFSGERCETETPKCVPGFCLNGGTCFVDQFNLPRCRCVAPWTGSNCQVSPPRPTTSPPDDVCQCEGDCQCEESCRHEAGFVCVSTSGYLGRRCNIPIPELECTSNEIIISISELFYAEWDLNRRNSIVYMSPTVDGAGSNVQDCQAQLVGSSYRIAMSHPFTQCGTQTATEVNVDGFNRVSFTNTMWINKDFGATAIAYDMPFGIIRFKCIYANSYNIYTSIRPLIDDPPVITDEMEYQISASLCKVSTCNAVCPAALTLQQSAVYTVGQVLHLDIGVFSSTPDAVAVIQSAVISCSASSPVDPLNGNNPLLPSPDSQIDLFQAGCPTEPGVALEATMGLSSIDGRTCFSFRIPRSKACSEFYIHVRLQVCNGIPQQQTCSNGVTVSTCSAARRKRSSSATVDSPTRPVIIGPIYLLEREVGDGLVTFLLDNAEMEFTTTIHHNVTTLPRNPRFPAVKTGAAAEDTTLLSGVQFILIAGVIIMFVVLLTSALLFVQHRRSVKPDRLGLPLDSL